MTTLARRVAQRGHEMALAHSGAGDKHDVAALLDEVQVKQVLDQQAVDLGRPVPVELIERLEHGEAGQIDTPLHAAIIVRGGLPVDQFGEIVQV